MADPRNTIGNGAPPALRPITPIRSEAARAAQRAFFDAALGKTPAAPQTPAVAAPAVVPPAVVQVQASAPTAVVRPTTAIASLVNAFRSKPSPETITATDAPPTRILRPGSIVDIKV
jgi:hypothetical protein